MKYLLDTNTCIRYLNRSAPDVLRRMKAVSPLDLCLCSIVKAELLYGAHKSNYPEQSLARLGTFVAPFVSFPFDDASADAYGHIRSHLERTGTVIGPNDLAIAAIALAQGLTVVTNNIREFSLVPNVEVEDWEKE